ncbi:MAG TPA: MBL fold metallo-hydrolase [Planctomycetota bacterium]
MLVTCFAFALATGLPQGGEAEQPIGLTVVIVDVGQGDGIVVRAPDGQVHVIDAGPNGLGTAAVLPAIGALQPASFGFTFLSHFHDDHQGGLDEVLIALPFQFAYDRGDVNRPSNTGVNNYLAAAGTRRRTATLGTIYQLGGGATLRCIALNGNVLGGAFVDPTASSQEENSRSIALRLDYGQFSMWFGGDLTGGGSSTANVESPASLSCGDVDVYKVGHHGSSTSTNVDLVARLAPELAVVSCGAGNPYGHPTTTIVNRLNQAAASRTLLSTTTGSAATIGFGVAGRIRIDTDGTRYRATAQNGDCLDFYCDEVQTPALAAGSVRISEVHRNPSIVPDTNGEYVEVINTGSRPHGLRGLRLSSSTATVTIASNFQLVPGRPMLFQVDGAPSRNGGQPLGACLPFSSLSLADTSGSLVLQQNTTTVDSLSWASGFPGGSGIAAERRDLHAPHSAANYAAAVAVFGAGDRGSPGRRNDADATTHAVQIGVTTAPSRFTLHGSALDHGYFISLIGLAYGSSPGIPWNGALIPLNFDPLFQAALGAPSGIALMPVLGYRSLTVQVPVPNPVAGIPLFAAHVVLDYSLAVPGLSPAISFVLP